MRNRLIGLLLMFGLSCSMLLGTAAAKPATYPVVTLDYRGADLVYVLRQLAAAMHLNIVIDSSVKGTVNADLRNVRADRALRLIATVHNLTYRTEFGNVLIVEANGAQGP